MFGISFGKNKSRDTMHTTTSGTQNQSGTNQTTTTGSSSTTGSQSSQSSGSSTTTQGTTGTSTQTVTTSNFGQSALTAIDSKIGDFITQMLGGGAGGAAASSLGSFDADKFIADTMASATQSTQDQVGEGIRGVTSSIGGNASENSASALLANRIANAGAASLAGVRANAEQTAQNIITSRAQTLAAAEQGGQNALAQILNAIKGGTSTTTGSSTNGQTTTASTNTNESTNQQSQSNTNTTQSALEIIQQLLTTNQVQDGTQTSSKSGGGLSLGL